MLHTLPMVTEALVVWNNKIVSEWRQTNDVALESSRRRCIDIAKRVAALLYILNGYKENNLVVDLAQTFAEYAVRAQIMVGGDALVDALNNEKQLMNNTQKSSVLITYLGYLPEEFTKEQFNEVRF